MAITGLSSSSAESELQLIPVHPKMLVNMFLNLPITVNMQYYISYKCTA